MIAETGGFTCMHCGMYVMWGAYHQCQPQFTIVPPVYVDPTLEKLDEIIELLKQILEEVT